MSDARSPQEPTMEEILSSIRRIISEDGDTEAAPPEEDGPKAGASEAAAVEPPPAGIGADDDIFDLADMGDVPPSEPPPPAPTSPSAEDDGDVLELTDIIEDDDDTVVQLRDEAPALEAEPTPTPVIEPEPEAFEPEPEAIEVEPELPPFPIGDAAPTMAEFEGLVSAEAAAEASVSLTGLHHTVAATRGVPIAHPGRTLEDIVKELLRPMLKQWLDRNLSVIVERIVSREISKLVGRTEDEKR
jgi:cell pole-organizing protein PopZ